MEENKDISIQLLCTDKDRLDLIMSNNISDYSRAHLQEWIKSGYVYVNQKCVQKPSFKVEIGDTIQIKAPQKMYVENQPEDIPLNILYHDDDIIIVDKSKNFVVHPGAGQPSNTLLNALLYRFPENNLLPRAGIVHRLDKDTTGLMVVAKTLQAHTHLTQALKSHEVTRKYRCICYGQMIQSGAFDNSIGRHATNRLKMSVRSDGQYAKTNYKILKRFKHFSYLELTLETGRTHQIRVHLSHHKHAILGDKTYGQQKFIKNAPKINELIQSISSQVLHATELSLSHPRTQEEIRFKSDLPEEFTNALTTIETFD